ncbi:sigma-70 family RNA polymerase sigma factor [Streptomyces sp.]|uniref:sigma-70 family RNA polymerase sigma factor n=1 Tax=Streptomyces sp. TaxID=1931 RepID=UPI002F42301F
MESRRIASDGVRGGNGCGGAGCEAFLHALYEEYGGLLLRFAARLLDGDWHRAEDVLQEAAVRAWRHRDVLESQPEGLRPWLFTVVRNLVIDAHRASRTRPALSDSLEDVDPFVSDEVERLLTARVVTEALEDLNGQQREVLRQMYFLGSSVAQASDALGIPPGTVKSRTHHAMRALKKALQARGVQP